MLPSQISGGETATPLEQRPHEHAGLARARRELGDGAGSAASASGGELDRGRASRGRRAPRRPPGGRPAARARRAAAPPARGRGRSGPRARRCRAPPAPRRSTTGGRRRSRRGAASARPALEERRGDRGRRRRRRRAAGSRQVTPLANVIRSGRTSSQRSIPNQVPEPAEAADHRVDDEQDRRARRTGRRRPRCSPSGGGCTPPAPITGSQKKAATRSGPTRRISASSAGSES